MSSTRPIRALLRGLEVLHVLNRHNGATVSEVAGEIDLPRTTTYRILETLCVAGYAYRAASDDRYRLTIMVRGLSDGFDDEAWVTLIGRQYLYDLCQDLVWPCAIATLSGSTMLVRQTTDHRSPLAVEKRGPGFRVTILGSAAGLAYLSFCPKEQRDTLLEMLAKSKEPENQAAKNKKKVYETLVETRKRGFAIWYRKRRVANESSFAVPIIVEDRLLACLSMRFASTAVPEADAIERFVPKLRKAAQDIADEFIRQHQRDPIDISIEDKASSNAA
jgi:IclR family mhp operon transcriptional activator